MSDEKPPALLTLPLLQAILINPDKIDFDEIYNNHYKNPNNMGSGYSKLRSHLKRVTEEGAFLSASIMETIQKFNETFEVSKMIELVIT